MFWTKLHSCKMSNLFNITRVFTNSTSYQKSKARVQEIFTALGTTGPITTRIYALIALVLLLFTLMCLIATPPPNLPANSKDNQGVVISKEKTYCPLPIEPVLTPVNLSTVIGDIILKVCPARSQETADTIANEILYQVSVYEMNQDEDLPYILSLYYQESGFNPLAANPTSTARGVGQILMSIHGHKFDSYEDWKDPAKNIAVSFQILYGGYNSDLKPSQRWSRALRRYCGTSSNANNALRHVPRFKTLLKPTTL